MVRPDIFVSKDLVLSQLPRAKNFMFSNSHGQGEGDFHFIMEHVHAEMLTLALKLHNGKAHVVSLRAILRFGYRRRFGKKFYFPLV